MQQPSHAQLPRDHQFQIAQQHQLADVPFCPWDAVTCGDSLTAVAAAAAPWRNSNQAQQQFAGALSRHQQLGPSLRQQSWQLQQGLPTSRAQQQLAAQEQQGIQQTYHLSSRASKDPFMQQQQQMMQQQQQWPHQAVTACNPATHHFVQPQHQPGQQRGVGLGQLGVYRSIARQDMCATATHGSLDGGNQHLMRNSSVAESAVTAMCGGSSGTAAHCTRDHALAYHLTADTSVGAAHRGTLPMVTGSCPALHSVGSEDVSSHTTVGRFEGDTSQTAVRNAAGGCCFASAAVNVAQAAGLQTVPQATTVSPAWGVFDLAPPLGSQVVNSFNLSSALLVDDELPWSPEALADVLEDLISPDQQQQQVPPSASATNHVNVATHCHPSSVAHVSCTRTVYPSIAALSGPAVAASHVAGEPIAEFAPVTGALAHKRRKLTGQIGTEAALPAAASAQLALPGSMVDRILGGAVRSAHTMPAGLPTQWQSMVPLAAHAPRQSIKSAAGPSTLLAASGSSASAAAHVSYSTAMAPEYAGSFLLTQSHAQPSVSEHPPASCPIIGMSLFQSLLEAQATTMQQENPGRDVQARLQQQHKRRMQHLRRGLASLVPGYSK